MSVLINPGSGGVPARGKGWTNTRAGAHDEAHRWLTRMHDSGLVDVELMPDPTYDAASGRWTFSYRHKVTGVVCLLQTHGITDLRAYAAEHVFTPRQYWCGSSSADPKLEDWLAPGWLPHLTFRPDPTAATEAADA